MIQQRFLSMVVLAAGLCTASTTQAQSFCVFDFSGTAGDAYALMQDFALASRGWGVELQLKAYKEEQDVVKAFKAKGVMRWRLPTSVHASLIALSAP